MATWLTHLRIAEKIKNRIKDMDLDYLMAGSIAPDSGRPDETYRKYEPSKEITHFKKEKNDEVYIDFTAFYNKHLQPEKLIMRSDKTRSFYWGYYFHLLTDKLWFNDYFQPNKNKFQGKGDFVDLIRDEMYSLDFQYLEENTEAYIFKEFLNMNIRVDFIEEFSPEILYETIDRIKEYYLKESFKLNRNYEFLNLEIIEKFISDATEICINAMYK